MCVFLYILSIFFLSVLAFELLVADVRCALLSAPVPHISYSVQWACIVSDFFCVRKLKRNFHSVSLCCVLRSLLIHLSLVSSAVCRFCVSQWPNPFLRSPLLECCWMLVYQMKVSECNATQGDICCGQGLRARLTDSQSGEQLVLSQLLLCYLLDLRRTYMR